MVNKKAQGLQLNTIILIILGVVVLVILIAGFIVGWSKILPFIQSSNNVQEVATQCSLACATSSDFDFCDKDKDVGVDRINKDLSCEDLAKITDRNLGIDACPSITCTSS